MSQSVKNKLTPVRFSTAIFLLLPVLPVDTGALVVGLGDLVQVAVPGSVGILTQSTGGVILPAAHSALDTLVIKVGVIFNLEFGQDLLKLLHSGTSLVSLPANLHQRIAQLVDPALSNTRKSIDLALALATGPDNLALLLLDRLEASLETLDLSLGALDLGLQTKNVVLDILRLPPGIHKKILLLSQGSSHGFLTLLLLLPPLLAYFLATILALGSTDARPLIAAIAALLVITDSVVDAMERYIRWPVSLVFAVEPGQRQHKVQAVASWALGNSQRGVS
jgi:hypothetical protein